MAIKTDLHIQQEPFILQRTKHILSEQLKQKGAIRITYVSLKQRLIDEFGETEFGRNKPIVQKILEAAVRKEQPQIADAYAKEKARQAIVGLSGQHVSNLEAIKTSSTDSKAPKLFFYKMSEEDFGTAEGNRYIQNHDL
jgi:hypothetical protein